MYRESNGVWVGMVLAVALLGAAPQPHPGVASTVNVKLSEWNVVLSQASVAAGPVTFVITNAGSIPHGLEVEGQGIEQEIETISCSIPCPSTSRPCGMLPAKWKDRES